MWFKEMGHTSNYQYRHEFQNKRRTPTNRIIDKLIERWRVIEGFENHRISTFGRVQNILPNCGNYLKPAGNKNSGALAVVLYDPKSERYKSLLVHRLVAQAFLKNPENKPNVVHVDGNITNNHFHNLRYETNTEKVRRVYGPLLTKPDYDVTYRAEHKDQRQKKIQCECGGSYTLNHRSTHFKTNKESKANKIIMNQER